MNTGLLVAIAVLVVATVAGLLWRARQGRLVAVHPVAAGPAAAESGPVTLLQFSAPACGPCRRVRALCESLTGPGVRHVEVDAATEPERLAEYGVWRTPTLFVLDRAGRRVFRAVGVPRRAELERVVRQA